MRRRNYVRIYSWLTPTNIADFYRAIDEHRRKRVSAGCFLVCQSAAVLRAAKTAEAWEHWKGTTAGLKCEEEAPHC